MIYVVRGAARMRWGERLEFMAEAGAGDFIFVPPYVPHQEINALPTRPLECVLVRSDNESVVVNLTIEAAERVEEVYWVDSYPATLAPTGNPRRRERSAPAAGSLRSRPPGS